MWNELETLVKTHVGNSERHQRVLECITACRSKPPEEEERKKRGRKREDKEEKDKNGKDSEEKSWTAESERLGCSVFFQTTQMSVVEVCYFEKHFTSTFIKRQLLLDSLIPQTVSKVVMYVLFLL